MKDFLPMLLTPGLLIALASTAQVPDNLIAEGVPAHTPELRHDVGRYLEFRAASFLSWHPQRREMLVSTRFADTPQLHLVRTPGGTRRQLTFFAEPIGSGSFRPRTGEMIVFAQDTGGGEFYQLYRYDLADGKVTLLTDGKSRNSGLRWSNSGKWFAYTSTRRNGRDNDIHLMNPSDPKSDRKLIEVTGGGWSVLDWSSDDATLLLREYISINESHLWLADSKTGVKHQITSRTGEKTSWTGGQFGKDPKSLFATTDKGSEFQRLCKIKLPIPIHLHPQFPPSGVTSFEVSHQEDPPLIVLTPGLKWDVEHMDLAPDGKTLAFVSNENGASTLHLLDAKTGRERRAPKLPSGVIGGLAWHENSRDLAFSLSSARSPNDAYSLDTKTGRVERWTESETGGLNPEAFVEPDLIQLKSFDGLGISAFIYRPDPKKFPGPRPVIISIHGGPESQSRPVFQARNNYYLNELGVAMVFPNVRGSDGYGKTFLTLDNGFKREDSVRDIGAVVEWISKDARLDRARIAVTGGSYGGYMTLATMTHFNDRLRCGVDVVGISNFLTFLKNTQAYRQDLRRAEYGDERDPKMAAHLETISPTTNVKKITKPMFVVQGKNDPRVPMTEAEQMVKALRENPGGGTAWYLMAKDEGHGFQKKKNADFQFLSTILFYREHLLK